MVMQFLRDNKLKKINNKTNKPIYIEKAYQILVKLKLIDNIPANIEQILQEGQNLLHEAEIAELQCEVIEEEDNNDEIDM
jgi:hypothetical protein